MDAEIFALFGGGDDEDDVDVEGSAGYGGNRGTAIEEGGGVQVGGEDDEEEEEEEEEWYLMAGTWLSRWHSYVLSGTGQDIDFPTPPPGPITNGDLVDEKSVPIPGKVAGKHYR